ncbi:MAG: type II toxin-antitoxin system Phd/YefM family antitoxin [Anaerolineales bacterium]|nr:type II toxin-antitoxin system Phd/YefM family antitoxin [Anaerolineales bacterium]
MDKLPEIIPLSDLRQESASVFQRLQDGDSPMVITQRGRAAGVLLSMEGYEQLTQAYNLLQLLIAGEKEIAADAGHDFDDVMAEADALLGDE